MAQVGTGKYTYELIRDFLKSPDGEPFGLVSRVAADAQDRIYVFQRQFLRSWSSTARATIWAPGAAARSPTPWSEIVDDVVYTTDRSDSVAKSFTLDGKPLLELGRRGQHSDTGNVTNWLAERAAGPFNHPTEMMAHPNGDIYVTDGYRNARVHRFTRDGQLVNRGARRARPRASSTCRTASRSTTTASFMWPIDRTSASRSSRPTATSSANGPAWAAPTTSPAARTAISTSPSRKTTASQPISASATDKEMCSPAWRAAMSTALVWTTRRHLRRPDPGAQRRQVRAGRLSGEVAPAGRTRAGRLSL